MARSLDELKRLAYGRPCDPAAALGAQRELAELAAAPTPREPVSMPLTGAIPLAAIAAMLVAVLALGISATLIALRPDSSLAAFDRPQTQLDRNPPFDVQMVTRAQGSGFAAVADSLRLVALDGRDEIWIWRSGDGDVCLGLFRLEAAAGLCTPVATFELVGLDLVEVGHGVGTQTKSVHWGPTGDPVVTIGAAANGIPDK